MTFTCNICRFLPSRSAANGIGDILKKNFTDPWPSWKKIPISTRNSLFEEFLVKFLILIITFDLDMYI